MTLKDYCNSLQRKEKSQFKKMICDALLIDSFQLYRRLNLGNWSPLEMRVLRTALKKHGHEEIEI